MPDDAKPDPQAPDDADEEHPVDEAVEQTKNPKAPPRDERSGPQPPPGMDEEVKEQGQGRGPAPLPRDSIGGRD